MIHEGVKPRVMPPPAGYASVMVPMDLGPDAEDRIKLAMSLADRFSSHLIGIAAHPIAAPLYFETPVPGVQSGSELAERQAATQLAMAETMFRRVVGTRNRAEWRQAYAFPTPYTLEQSRAADLLVATLPRAAHAGYDPMRVDAGDLVMGAGRAILFAPPRTDYLSAKRIVVGWKDTAEARRAVADALPLLRAADEVYVACVGTEAGSASDVCTWLGWHGVETWHVHREAGPDSAAAVLADVASENGADLIVCGAYGHSRAQEWLLGGVTRALLDRSPLCCLMAH